MRATRELCDVSDDEWDQEFLSEEVEESHQWNSNIGESYTGLERSERWS